MVYLTKSFLEKKMTNSMFKKVAVFFDGENTNGKKLVDSLYQYLKFKNEISCKNIVYGDFSYNHMKGLWSDSVNAYHLVCHHSYALVSKKNNSDLFMTSQVPVEINNLLSSIKDQDLSKIYLCTGDTDFSSLVSRIKQEFPLLEVVGVCHLSKKNASFMLGFDEFLLFNGNLITESEFSYKNFYKNKNSNFIEVSNTKSLNENDFKEMEKMLPIVMEQENKNLNIETNSNVEEVKDSNIVSEEKNKKTNPVDYLKEKFKNNTSKKELKLYKNIISIFEKKASKDIIVADNVESMLAQDYENKKNLIQIFKDLKIFKEDEKTGFLKNIGFLKYSLVDDEHVYQLLDYEDLKQDLLELFKRLNDNFEVSCPKLNKKLSSQKEDNKKETKKAQIENKNEVQNIDEIINEEAEKNVSSRILVKESSYIDLKKEEEKENNVLAYLINEVLNSKEWNFNSYKMRDEYMKKLSEQIIDSSLTKNKEIKTFVLNLHKLIDHEVKDKFPLNAFIKRYTVLFK